MEIFTIGFAGKTAERFFEPLKAAGVRQLIDVRLNNVSQLAGFTKKADLPYFLDRVAGIGYRHEVSLAPLPEMLDAYRHKEIDWDTYARRYLGLLIDRDVAATIDRASFGESPCLLCSESSADKCHRRLAAEFLASRWPDVTVHHL